MTLQTSARLKEVIRVFFTLGCIAFGGPAAHIAMMEAEVVGKRRWMSSEHFLDLVGLTNLIPGPNSTEMTMHCGKERAGLSGLFAAGISFILPAATLSLFLAWTYEQVNSLPLAMAIFRGIKPAVLAIIASAVLKLGKKAFKDHWLTALAVLTLLLCLAGMNEIQAMMGCALVGGILRYAIRHKPLTVLFPLAFFTPEFSTQKAINTLGIFLSFLKIGAILYGSGYVLFAYLEAEWVSKGLLDRGVLMDAIAIGQLTPGPVLSTATFIGYHLYGFKGALAATAGIFLPSFIFVWMLNPLLPRLRKSPFFSKVLDALNAAAVAVMASVLLTMGRDSLMHWQGMVIAVWAFSWVYLLKRSNAIELVAGGALLGWLLY